MVNRPGALRMTARPRPLPPRWFVVAFWHAHRALVNATRGRLGLWRPKPNGWGALRLTTSGRRTGRARAVVVGYVEDGDDLVTMAMNGWADREPAWWLKAPWQLKVPAMLGLVALGGAAYGACLLAFGFRPRDFSRRAAE